MTVIQVRMMDLEETMPTTVKSITINGGQRVNTVDENGNVDLTIYSDGGQDYEGLTEVVADLRDIVGENPEEPQSGTLLERVDTLEDAVGTGGSTNKLFKCMRIGLNNNKALQEHNYFCWDYKNKKLVGLG